MVVRSFINSVVIIKAIVFSFYVSSKKLILAQMFIYYMNKKKSLAGHFEVSLNLILYMMSSSTNQSACFSTLPNNSSCFEIEVVAKTDVIFLLKLKN